MNKKEEKEKEPVKKEEKKPKTNAIQEKLKMMMANNQNKPGEVHKPTDKDAPKKKPNEGAKNAFAERIKNMEAANNTKKQEKKEEPKKINKNFLDKLNKIQSGEQPKKEEKPQEKPKLKNPFLEKLNHPNSQELNANTKKNEPPKSNVMKKFEAGFASKLAQMNDLFKKQGADGMKHRLSAVAPKPKFGLNKPATTTTNPSSSNNLGIINEEPDKMKEGYDPAANLQQTLEHVVIQKNKKKKKRPTDF